EVLGQKSFGKGSVQIPVTLPEGIFKLTIAHFYTPKGVNLANNGIEPDQEFRMPPLENEEQKELVRLLGDSLISGFVSQNRQYTEQEFQAFFAAEIAGRYKVSEERVARIAFNEKMRYMKKFPIYNLKYDYILRDTVEYISEIVANVS
ncbi:MAG: S41 family peptidase, partial [Spirochaetota bacterium]